VDGPEEFGPAASGLVDDSKKRNHAALMGMENVTTMLSSSNVTVCCSLGVSVLVVVFSPLVVRVVRRGSAVVWRREALRLSDELLERLALELREELVEREEDWLEDWLPDWLREEDWLPDWVPDWLREEDWLEDWLPDWLRDELWLPDWLPDWLRDELWLPD
jgi:hypothetical protein